MSGRHSMRLIGLALVLAGGGCQQMAQSVGRQWVKRPGGGWELEVVRPGEQIENALSSDNPDKRREGVQWMSTPERSSQELVVRLLAAVVRDDPDPTVRSAAVRALGKSSRPDALPPLIDALEDANEYVRRDAADVLAFRTDDTVKRALLVRLGKDPVPQVRAAAARGLAIHHERRVVEALIGALRDRHFVVVYSAEQSLIDMTGHTFEYNADAWTRWLAGTGAEGDPFALSGQTPPSLQPPAPSLGERMRRSLRRAWFWWQAEEKP